MVLTKRLLLLSAVVLLPGLATIAYNELELRSSRAQDVRDDVLRETRQVIGEVSRVFDSLKSVLLTASAAPVSESPDRAQCDAYLESVLRRLDYIAGIAIAEVSGDVKCSSHLASEANVADRPYFRQALEQGGFVIGEFTRGSTAGVALLPVALSILGDDGRPRGVAFAMLNLGWLQARMVERGMENGSSLTIADRNGVIIVRDPLPAQFVGTQIPDAFVPLVRGSTSGMIDATSQDGTVRVLGYVPPALSGIGLYVSTGAAKTEAFKLIDQATRTTFLLTLLSVATSLLLAWLMSSRFVRRPVAAILKTIEDWRAGDTRARTGMQARDGELAVIGASLDGLMDQLERRQIEQARAEQQRELVTREMGHRLKNALAIVQAIGVQSFRKLAGAEVAVRTFAERVTALAKAYNIILADDWEHSNVAAAIRAAVEPFASGGNRVHLAGPEEPIDAKAVLALTLIMHELCTNAIKYGALSVPEGRIDVSWQTTVTPRGNRVSVAWREHDGPPVVSPQHRGFGSTLIDSAFNAQLEATLMRDYSLAGLEVHLEFQAFPPVVPREPIAA